jgi:hypothetical protein
MDTRECSARRTLGLMMSRPLIACPAGVLLPQPRGEIREPTHRPHIADREDAGLRLPRVQHRVTEITIFILYIKGILGILNPAI